MINNELQNEMNNILGEIKKSYLFYLSRYLNEVMVLPDMIQVMLTSKCNVRCKICDVWKQRFENELNAEKVKSLIDQAINMGIKTIYFTGGEAFLRKDIFELINYASRPGIITTVNTNGSFITEEFAKKIVLSKLRNVTFSIDSSTPEVHNSIRGKDVFEKAIQAIEFINYYRKKFDRESKDGDKRRLDIGMVSVIMKCNIEELPQLVKLARKTGCCYIAFQPLVYNGSLLENYNLKSDFWIEEKDISKLENIFRELEFMKREMLSTGFYIDFMLEKTIQYFRKERKVNTCFAGFSRVFVNPQGDISFVCFESFGNVKSDTLKDVWHSQKANEIRKKIKECNINCTQFCSERPESESLEIIHKNFQKTIFSRFHNELCVDLLIQENDFLNSFLSKVNHDEYIKEEVSKIQRGIDELIKLNS